MLNLIEIFSQLWTALLSAGPEGLVRALFVFVAILSLRAVKVLPSNTWARATNVVMSVLLSGVTTGAATESEVAIMTLTAGFAAGLWELADTFYQAKLKKKMF